MDEPTGSGAIQRLSGTVKTVREGFGFIESPAYPGKEIYFKAEWFKSSPPLRPGDLVTFGLTVYESGQSSASSIWREGRATPTTTLSAANEYHILAWAEMGQWSSVLAALAQLALPERWDYAQSPADPKRQFPILHSYLVHTFGHLVLENKVLVDDSGSWAAFNTGLVDKRYEPIHAIFAPGYDKWRLEGFCIPGEGVNGKNLVRYFTPRPSAAHYFTDPVEMLYDIKGGRPELSWEHIIVQRIDRYPAEFIRDHWPQGFPERDDSALSNDQRKRHYEELGKAIESDERTYRRAISRVRDAVDLAIKRVAWNVKTAVPQYYPQVKKLQLLLPLCVVSDDAVDVALAVEKTQSGTYSFDFRHGLSEREVGMSPRQRLVKPRSDQRR